MKKQTQLNPAISNSHGKCEIVWNSGGSKLPIVNDWKINQGEMVLSLKLQGIRNNWVWNSKGLTISEKMCTFHKKTNY